MYHFVTVMADNFGSHVKNSSRLPSFVWQPIKSLENKEQFFLRVAICSFARSVFFTLEKSNSSSLFLLILAKIDICLDFHWWRD